MSHSPSASNNDVVGDDLDPVVAYRPISSAAVAALLLGLASPLALAWTLFWILPLLGVLVALAALRNIARSEGTLAGRWAALVGIALSLLVGAMAISSKYVRNRTVAEQATPWGIKWCELLLEGKAAEALELKQDPMTRRPFSTLAEYYENNDAAKERLAEFREEELVALLLNAPDGSTVTPGPVDQVERSRGGYVVVRAFTLEPGAATADGAKQYAAPTVFSLQLRKSPDRGEIGGLWSVEAYRRGRLDNALHP